MKSQRFHWNLLKVVLGPEAQRKDNLEDSRALEGEVVNKEEKRSGARPPAVSSSLSPLLPALRAQPYNLLNP